ncbi:MAG: DUF58 domain-containing protein [Myxococcales bacterium]|nr:DUF58 domain-containing protein [Myxococcales bacterium]
MIPTKRLALLLAVPALLAATSALDATLLWPTLAADTLILVVALIDAVWAWRPRVRLRRRAPQVMSLGRPSVVELALHARVGRTLTVSVVDDVFAEADVEGLPATATVPGGGHATLTYRITPRRRGQHTLGAHHVRHGSPLGLWTRQQRLPAEDTVRVYPDIRAVQAFELLARQGRALQGWRTQRRRGGENEFDGLREYQRDDPYRQVDWRATARRGDLIVRTYKVEENQDLLFVLDGGRLMTAAVGGASLYDHALDATLMLAHVAVRNGDNVGVLGFADQLDAFVGPRNGRAAVRRVVDALFDVHPRLVESDLPRAFEHVARRVRKRALVVLFTQVVDEVAAEALLRSVRAVRRRHLVLCVVFRDQDVEAMATGADGSSDLFARAAAAELLSWRASLLDALRAGGALVLDVAAGGLTPALMTRYLEIKARQLL